MAGKLIVDTIDTDNAFITLNVQQSQIATMNVSGIYSNTGVKMIGANGTVSNTAITGNIISSQITSVANTQITGNIASSQITSNPTLYGNVSVTGVIGVGGATPSTSGSGITFPATQSDSSNVNTLDDYEEGTFSPVYSPQGGAFTTLTYYAQNGRYTKIGNIVFFELNVFTNSVTVGTASGSISISGLPFTSDSTSQLHPAPALGRVYRWANAISNMRAYIGAGGSQISFSSMATNAALATDVQVSDMTTGTNTAYNCLDITGCYKIA